MPNIQTHQDHQFSDFVVISAKGQAQAKQNIENLQKVTFITSFKISLVTALVIQAKL
jgi:hypothetical protein